MLVKQNSNFEATSDLVIVCEGTTDRELLALLATKILKEFRLTKKVNIIVAMGKMTIPRVANAAGNIITSAPVLIVTDSDNDIGGTRDMLHRGVELDSWEYSIPDPAIESWLGLDAREFRRRNRATEIREILNARVSSLDLEELSGRDQSFKTFYDWVKNA